MNIGRNTIDGRLILGFVERIERQEKIKKAASEEIKLVNAEATLKGYSKEGIGVAVKARAMKPSEFREGEDLRDLYLHAVGLAAAPPLFKYLESLAQEHLGKAELLERFKDLVPVNASLTLEMGGLPVRISRDKDGNVTTKDVTPAAKVAKSSQRDIEDEPEPTVEIPDVDDDGAEQYGRQLARDDKPITENPFPFGDKRRFRCDEGWRKEMGSDGMGPDDEG